MKDKLYALTVATTLFSMLLAFLFFLVGMVPSALAMLIIHTLMLNGMPPRL